MTELEKLKAGLEYCYDDAEVDALKDRAIKWCMKFNALDPLDFNAQRAVLKENLGSIGEKVWIAKTLNCDNGRNIHIGSNFTGNYNLTILDIREVYIGDNVMIGPNTLISTVVHPLSPMGRRKHLGIAKPVTIGNDVWIGGNVTILPGVTIGNNVVVAAGAVVSKDIPDHCVVAGIPAKKVKDIENDTEDGYMHTMELSNGVTIPAIGYGTWQSPDSGVSVEGVKTALSCGYRHIDAAAVYGNEQSVGKGIAECGIPREELFITSKVWNTERGYEKTLAAFEKTIKDLGVTYLASYLIHWPAAAHMYDNWEEINLETWRAMTELYKAGKIKAVGVSNFKPHHLKALMETEIKPMVNQIEFHPGLLQDETVQYCHANGILVEAWSPLGTGRMLTNPLLMEIAEKYGRSVAQICIRWVMQHDVVPLPKSLTPSRIEENLKVFDFEISAEDMKKIDSLNNFGGSGLDPDRVDF